MADLGFVEGVSGVGKSTMVQALHRRLHAGGYLVRSFLEGDCSNPIDFYAAAYLSDEHDLALCQAYPAEVLQLRRHAIPAGSATLVRYREGNRPLFSDVLYSELQAWEFSYCPSHPVPYADYASAYQAVWRAFDRAADRSIDYYLFDGSLLHHPLNDLIRNYGAAREQAAAHVQMLLGCLNQLHATVFYLSTEDVAGQLRQARRNRGQPPLDPEAIAFWERRKAVDRYVLEHVVPDCLVLDPGKIGYAAVLDRMAEVLQSSA